MLTLLILLAIVWLAVGGVVAVRARKAVQAPTTTALAVVLACFAVVWPALLVAASRKLEVGVLVRPRGA